MKPKRCLLSILTLLTCLTSFWVNALHCQAGSIYRYTDTDGAIRYTNCPVNLAPSAKVEVLSELESPYFQPLAPNPQRLKANALSERQKPFATAPWAPYTTLHQGIHLFSGLMDVTPDIDQLNSFILAAGRLIKDQDPTTFNGALTILVAIGRLIDRHDYAFKNPILAPADCKRSFLYTAVGEAYHLPLAIVNAPKHHFVRFMLEGEQAINWETTQKIALPDGYYVQRLNIDPGAIRKGVYLRNLTPREHLGEFYTIAGNELKKAGHYAQALTYHNIGVSLAARDPNALINRGVTMASINAFEGSIEDFTLALRLDPNSAEGYYNRGMSWLNLRKPTGAIRDFEKVLELDPANEKAKRYREMAMRIL